MKKRLFLIIAVAAAWCGCGLKENYVGCPASLNLMFELDDPFISGDFDSRIGNDVVLYIFKDGTCIDKRLIPYEKISSGKACTIRKSREMTGDIRLVAWAVPASSGDGSDIPDWEMGCKFDENRLELKTLDTGTHNAPASPELYIGSTSFVEDYDVSSSHTVKMISSVCRVEVRIKTPGDASLAADSEKYRVVIKGTMKGMNMRYEGVGEPAEVDKELSSDNGINYSTGIFGVMPSGSGQIVTVDIFAPDGRLIATLDTTTSSMHEPAKANGLIIFEYEINQTHFVLIVDGYREIIYDVHM